MDKCPPQHKSVIHLLHSTPVYEAHSITRGMMNRHSHNLPVDRTTFSSRSGCGYMMVVKLLCMQPVGHMEEISRDQRTTTGLKPQGEVRQTDKQSFFHYPASQGSSSCVIFESSSSHNFFLFIMLNWALLKHEMCEQTIFCWEYWAFLSPTPPSKLNPGPRLPDILQLFGVGWTT